MSATDSEVRESLHYLYSEHHGWLHGWLRKKLGCSHRAADLLHDTFLRLLVKDELESPQQPRAYLMTIAKRVLVDHWRRERVEQAYLEALTQLPEAVMPGPEEKYIYLETLLEIDRRLQGLPVVVKRTFLLAQLSGEKQTDIAAKLNISVSTVKRYLTQANMQCYFALKEMP